MNPLTDIAIGAAGKVIEAVGNAADDLFTSDDERNKAEIELRKIDVDLQKAHLADTDSARRMQMEALKQDDVFSKRFVYWFAVAWSLFAMIFLMTTTFMVIPEKNVRTVDTVLGFLLGTAISTIFSYFFGTTYRSQKKDDTIKALTEK